LAETPVSGGVVGPAIYCILVEEFNRILYGDRYFFTHTNGGSRFSSAQRQRLRSVLMAHLICSNTNIVQIQQYVFRIVSQSNPLLQCSSAPFIDINTFLCKLCFEKLLPTTSLKILLQHSNLKVKAIKSHLKSCKIENKATKSRLKAAAKNCQQKAEQKSCKNRLKSLKNCQQSHKFF
jgi:hypothetical protein